MVDNKQDNRLIQDRIKKVNEIRELGVNPYPYNYEVKNKAKDLKEKYSSLKPEEHTSDMVQVAGRIMLLRKMGKASFAIIQDDTAKIQVFLKKDEVGEDKYKVFKKSDIGDFFGFKGEVITTKTGELSVLVKDLQLLSKNIRPLPEKFHGLQDKELRYRQRYTDFIMNPEVKETFEKRSAIIKAIRDFMHEKGFIEVETPLLQTQYGGANARPFITHINAWDMPMFLAISPELYLKRYIVGGFEKVFTICKNFRNEGVDHSHNPEFTMLEAYQAYADYNDMMQLIEECYEYVSLKVLGTTKVKRTIIKEDASEEEIILDFKAPWPRVKFLDAIKEKLDLDVNEMGVDALKVTAENYNLEIENCESWGDYVSLLFDELVEDKYVQPTHIYDRPKEATPLCKRTKYDDRLNEQNEPVGAGMELGNMYSELNDPVLQRELLEEQASKLRAGADEAHPMDEDFVNAIETGMPPTGGIGWGIDRMIMLLLNQYSIRDVIAFPTMKPETQEEQGKKKEK